MKEILWTLYELQQLDSALDAIKRQFAVMDRGQAEKAHYDEVKARHAVAQASLHASDGTLTDNKLELQGVEEKRKQAEKKLYGGSVTNPKELQAMSDEVDMLVKRRERLQETQTGLLHTLEAARRQEAEIKRELKLAIAAFNAKATAAQEQTALLKSQAETLLAQRNAAAKLIAPNWLERYETFRTKQHGIAIVALEDSNACGGCKMGVSRDIVFRVRAGENTVCENCGRMLCEKQK